MTQKHPFHPDMVNRYISTLEQSILALDFKNALQRVPGHGEEDRQIALDVLMNRTSYEPETIELGKQLIEGLCRSGDGKDADIRWDTLWSAIKNELTEYVPVLIDTLVEKKGVRAASEMLLVMNRNPDTQAYQNSQISLVGATLDASDPTIMESVLGVLKRSKTPAGKIEGSIHWIVSIDGDLNKTQDRVRCVEMLLDYGLGIHEVNRQGDQPIHLVSTVDMAQLLIERGADVRAKGQRGNRPLYNLWLRRRAFRPNQYATNDDGRVYLPEAETLGVAALLIEHGASWKDAPTVDIMKLQLENHLLSEYLITGRKRAELAKFSKVELDLNPAPETPKKRPMM